MTGFTPVTGRFNASGLIALSLLLMVACLFGACSTSRAAQGGIKSVRVAFFPNIAHAQALLGRADGSFSRTLGLPVEWKEFNAGSAEAEALMAGEIDIGYIGPGPAMNVFIRSGGGIRVVSGVANAGAVLVVREDSPIRSIDDLSERKVAVPQYGNTQDLLLRALLAEHGLKDKAKGGTVEIVKAENPDIRTLFEQKAIDAALVPEPWGARLEKETNARVVLDEKQIWRNGDYPSAVLVVRTEFLDSHPELVQKFVNRHVALTDFALKRSAVTKKIVNGQLRAITRKQLSPEVLDLAFSRLRITTELDPETLSNMAELSLVSGYYREVPDLSGLVNDSFIQKAREAGGGKYQ